jgi:hypothetical protein
MADDFLCYWEVIGLLFENIRSGALKQNSLDITNLRLENNYA